MFNKQANDPDVAGIGRFVEENFINVGIGDHPVQALNALKPEGGSTRPNSARTASPTTQKIPGAKRSRATPDHAFKFRSLTLRQLKDGGNFFHNASFTKLRDVVEYFNAGCTARPDCGRSRDAVQPFHEPARGRLRREGPGSCRQGQVDDLTDFIENGLYDAAFRQIRPQVERPTCVPAAASVT